MKELIFITGNKHKLNEAKNVLEPLGFKVINENFDFIEPQDMKQKDIVVYKAKQAFLKMKKTLIVDDSGIYFEAYPDFPEFSPKA